MRYAILCFFLSFGLAAAAQVAIPQPAWLPEYCSAPRKGTVTHVMLHYISNALEQPENPYDSAAIRRIFTTYKLSAHYLIDREGRILALVPHERAAFHAGKGKLPHPPHHENVLNARSIGIEIMAVGTREEMALLGVKNYDRIAEVNRGFTDVQYKALAWLIQHIQQKESAFAPSPQTIVGHDAYAPQRRGDPGKLFDWNRLFNDLGIENQTP